MRSQHHHKKPHVHRPFKDIEQHPLQTSPLTTFFHVLWKRKTHWWRIEAGDDLDVGGGGKRDNVSGDDEDTETTTSTTAPFAKFRIPDTVIWENNVPKAWYHTDHKEGIVKKKVESTQIYNYFTKHVRTPADIVACRFTKISGLEAPTPNHHHGSTKPTARVAKVELSPASMPNTPARLGITYPVEESFFGPDPFVCEYLNPADLHDYLHAAKTSKGCSVLQQFILPQNGASNDVIEAIWSPGVVLVNRRQNIHLLTDQKFSLFERAATFEGPAYLSRVVACGPKLTSLVQTSAEEVVSHFRDTDLRNVITRMVLRFKLDSRFRLMLLYCASVRVVPVGRAEANRYPYIALELNLPIHPIDRGGAYSIHRDKTLDQALSILSEQDQREKKASMSAATPTRGRKGSSKQRVQIMGDSPLAHNSPVITFNDGAELSRSAIPMSFIRAKTNRREDFNFSNYGSLQSLKTTSTSSSSKDSNAKSFISAGLQRLSSDKILERLKTVASAPEIPEPFKFKVLLDASHELDTRSRASELPEYTAELLSPTSKSHRTSMLDIAGVPSIASDDELAGSGNFMLQANPTLTSASTLRSRYLQVKTKQFLEWIDDLFYQLYSFFMIHPPRPKSGKRRSHRSNTVMSGGGGEEKSFSVSSSDIIASTSEGGGGGGGGGLLSPQHHLHSPLPQKRGSSENLTSRRPTSADSWAEESWGKGENGSGSGSPDELPVPFVFTIPAQLEGRYSTSAISEIIEVLSAEWDDDELCYRVTEYCPIQTLKLKLEKIRASMRSSSRPRQEA